MTGEQRNPCPISEVSFLNVCKLQPFEEAHIDMPSYPVVRYRAESSNRGRGICSNAGQTGQSCCQNCPEPHFRLWCVVALRACIHAVYRVICHLERVATLTGFEPECMSASSFERFVGQIGTFHRARRFPRILSLRWISEQGFRRIVGDTLTSEMSVIGPSEVTKGNKVFA
jgi:hypothetical protein